MFPSWLNAPPDGLSRSERRVLEAYFISGDVKGTAGLLSLSPKTIQNELYAARLTMKEAKSWAAAIRYVFYAKRHSVVYVEAGLTPQIDGEIRRLVEDYFEETGSVSGHSRACTDLSLAEACESSSSTLLAQTSELRIESSEFEWRLNELIKCSVRKSDRQSRRKRGLWLTVSAAALLAFSMWGGAMAASEPLNLTQTEKALANSSDDRQTAELVDRLCAIYWDEMWGPNEEAVIEAMKQQAKKIDRAVAWAKVHDPGLALRILADGHRGLRRAGSLDGKWFSNLESAIAQNPSDHSVYMVRALCGDVFGRLNDGDKMGEILPVSERGKDVLAGQRALAMVDRKKDLADYANVLRHCAMTNLDTSERTAMCRQAETIYRQIGTERAMSGVGQCLLSISQSKGPHGAVELEQACDAWDCIKAHSNRLVEHECVEEILTDLGPGNSKQIPSALWQRTRRILREEAKQSAQEIDIYRQFELIRNCVLGDAILDPSLVPEDVGELVGCRASTRGGLAAWRKLEGYVLHCLSRDQQPGNVREDHSGRRDPAYKELLDSGSRLSVLQVAELVRSMRPS